MSSAPFSRRSAPIPSADRPDPSYWTSYDHFMIEREARAARHAYVSALFGRWLSATSRRARAFASRMFAAPSGTRTPARPHA